MIVAMLIKKGYYYKHEKLLILRMVILNSYINLINLVRSKKLFVELALIGLTVIMVKGIVGTMFDFRVAMLINLSAYGNNTKVYYTDVNESYPKLKKLSDIYQNLLPNDAKYTPTDDVFSGNAIDINWVKAS